jgi:pilus assembly protein Flp/PilA
MVRLTTIARFAGQWVATRLSIKSERGATAVEYGVMVALIAAVIIAAVVVLGSNAKDSFQCTADSIGAQANKC